MDKFLCTVAGLALIPCSGMGGTGKGTRWPPVFTFTGWKQFR